MSSAGRQCRWTFQGSREGAVDVFGCVGQKSMGEHANSIRN